jgi:hypothetical protein
MNTTRVIARLPDSLGELCLLRLGIQSRGLRGLIYAGKFGLLQYWRSFSDLEAWSHRPPHSDWWRGAVERMRTRGDFGIYHETYLVPRDRIESIYLGCRPAGLLIFGETGDPVGPDTNSRGRLRMGKPSDPPVV